MSETTDVQDGKYDVMTSMALLTQQSQTRTRGGHLALKGGKKKTLRRGLLNIPGGYDSFCSSLEPYPKYLWINDEYDGIIRSNVIQLCGDTPFPIFAEGATQERLMSATTTPQPDEKCRRIIIVEDMNRRTAELLGVRLNIPTEFFFAHCNPGRLHLSVVNGASAPQLDQYWRVYLPGIRWVLGPLNEDEHSGDWMVEAGSSYRENNTLLIGPKGCDGLHIDANEYVSYWATEYENESWTIVLLVDPKERTLRRENDRKSTLKANSPRLDPGRFATEVLPSATENPMTQAENRSIPMSGTAFVRNLIRAVWEESIYRTEAEINDKLYEDRFQYGFYRDVKQTYTENDRNAQSYHGLIQKRIEVQFWREQLKRTTYAFSMDIDYQRSQPQLPTKLTEARESRIWARLHEKLATMESTISNHMEAFSARAALEVSFAAYRQAEESKHQTREANEQTTIANRHARSAGQLTKIATIIVPCTFVASIFSMGGSFAAGEHLFFVYWAISVPITAALLAWVLHKDIKEMWHKWRGHQNKEEKQADKMA
ncbi:hypothetical protein G6514_001242 [Epicoccum nigrum]|nr:hypothetical protein G6514_001242 [Epicoccum nigrum]